MQFIYHGKTKRVFINTDEHCKYSVRFVQCYNPKSHLQNSDTFKEYLDVLKSIIVEPWRNRT